MGLHNRVLYYNFVIVSAQYSYAVKNFESQFEHYVTFLLKV